MLFRPQELHLQVSNYDERDGDGHGLSRFETASLAKRPLARLLWTRLGETEGDAQSRMRIHDVQRRVEP